MPWKVSGPVDERNRFVEAHQSGLYTMTELCLGFEISRRTGYKWLDRYRAGGAEALQDRSRSPRTSPQRTPSEIEALLLDARASHPSWGPRKILPWLQRRHPELESVLPAASTVGDLFLRSGLVKKRKRRPRRSFEIAGALRTEAPNEVWTADFKGEFRLKNRLYCYPFTLADAHTRYLLACEAETSTSLAGVRKAMIAAFRTYGMPWAIRTDNGTPFVGHGVSGLCTLNVWWIKLGIRQQRIPKSRPDQNGRHERMHRTLKAETTRPPEPSFAKQQDRFDHFRCEFNDERPHEALEQQTPSSQYTASSRIYPGRIELPEYPGHFEVRKIDHKGYFKFRGYKLFIAEPMAGEFVGLEEIDNDIWCVRFYDMEIGRLNTADDNFIIKVLPMSPV